MVSYAHTQQAFNFRHTPRIFYKYIDENAAEFVRQGKIRLRRLSAFRKIEDQPTGIHDPMEGRIQLVAKDLLIKGDSDPNLRSKILEHFGVKGVEDIYLDHTHLIGQTIDYWVLCLTCHPKSFWPDRPYVWRISDMRRALNVLIDAAPIDLRRGRMGSVRYEPRVGDLATDHHMRPHPLVKGPRFAWQKEERAFFDPGRETASDILDIDCPEIIKFGSVTRATIDEHHFGST